MVFNSFRRDGIKYLNLGGFVQLEPADNDLELASCVFFLVSCNFFESLVSPVGEILSNNLDLGNINNSCYFVDHSFVAFKVFYDPIKSSLESSPRG